MAPDSGPPADPIALSSHEPRPRHFTCSQYPVCMTLSATLRAQSAAVMAERQPAADRGRRRHASAGPGADDLNRVLRVVVPDQDGELDRQQPAGLSGDRGEHLFRRRGPSRPASPPGAGRPASQRSGHRLRCSAPVAPYGRWRHVGSQGKPNQEPSGEHPRTRRSEQRRRNLAPRTQYVGESPELRETSKSLCCRPDTSSQSQPAAANHHHHTRRTHQSGREA